MSENAGQWELTHPAPVGRTPKKPPEMIWSWYVGGEPCPCDDLGDALAAAKAGHGYVWIGLHNPSQVTMSRLGHRLGLHELAIEDAVHGHRRSKLEKFDDTLFIVVSTVDYVERGEHKNASEIVTTGELMIFLGPYFVMTSRHTGKSRMPEVRAEVEKDSEDMPLGPSRVLYACLAVAIDDFERVVRQMEEDVEDAEELVFGTDSSPEIERPYEIKRELIEFRRCVAPLGAPLATLVSRDFAVIPAEAKPYFRELADKVQLTRESIMAMDDQLTNILQAALARASVTDNRDMRKISSYVAILAVPTTMGAIYGMNFDNIPELHWEFGFYLVLVVNVILMVIIYLLFRRFRWL